MEFFYRVPPESLTSLSVYRPVELGGRTVSVPFAQPGSYGVSACCGCDSVNVLIAIVTKPVGYLTYMRCEDCRVEEAEYSVERPEYSLGVGWRRCRCGGVGQLEEFKSVTFTFLGRPGYPDDQARKIRIELCPTCQLMSLCQWSEEGLHQPVAKDDDLYDEALMFIKPAPQALDSGYCYHCQQSLYCWEGRWFDLTWPGLAKAWDRYG